MALFFLLVCQSFSIPFPLLSISLLTLLPFTLFTITFSLPFSFTFSLPFALQLLPLAFPFNHNRSFAFCVHTVPFEPLAVVHLSITFHLLLSISYNVRML